MEKAELNQVELKVKVRDGETKKAAIFRACEEFVQKAQADERGTFCATYVVPQELKLTAQNVIKVMKIQLEATAQQATKPDHKWVLERAAYNCADQLSSIDAAEEMYAASFVDAPEGAHWLMLLANALADQLNSLAETAHKPSGLLPELELSMLMGHAQFGELMHRIGTLNIQNLQESKDFLSGDTPDYVLEMFQGYNSQLEEAVARLNAVIELKQSQIVGTGSIH